MRSAASWIVLSVLAVACGESPGTEVRTERESRGDTTIVRTLSGSAWGSVTDLEEEVRIGLREGEEHYMLGRVAALAVGPDGSIYAMDTSLPALRKYAADGTYVATFGREGGGPGEYSGPDGGLAVLPDGRVVLRDPGNGRFQVYAADGTALATWPLLSGLHSSNPLVVDTAGYLYSATLISAEPGSGSASSRWALARYDTETGEAVDTVFAPTWSDDGTEFQLVAERMTERGPARSTAVVPFTPRSAWAFSPLGHMVGGFSTAYAIDQFFADGAVLRIERVHEPVRIHPEEKSQAEARVQRMMRGLQPNWRWNAAPIPDVKPPFTDIHAGLDGRLWVTVPQPGERIPRNEVEATVDPNAPSATRWRARIAFDVFEPDGTYLGRVRAPHGFATLPRPVFHGDRVWAIVRDELDVQYIVRFRVRR